MTDPNRSTPPPAGRLARRIYGFARAHSGLLIAMGAVMTLLAAVDRGRAYLVKPLFDQLGGKVGVPVTCPGCGERKRVSQEEDYCRVCGGSLREAREAAGRDGGHHPPHLTCSVCGHRNSSDPETAFCARCGRGLEEEWKAAATPQGAWGDLYRLAFLLLAASLLMFPLKYGGVYLANLLTERVLYSLRNEVSAHLLRLPLRYYHDRKAGDILSRVSNDTVVMQSCVSFLLEDVFLQPLYLLAAVGLVLAANWQLGLATIVFFPLYSIPILKIGRAVRHARRKSLERMGDLTESMTQMFGGIRVVKAFHREAEERATFEDRNRHVYRKVMSTVRKKALAESLVEVFISLGIASLILLGGFLFLEQEMTHGEMVLFALALAMVNTPIKQLTKGYNRFQESLAAAERIFEILDTEPEPPDTPDAVSLPAVAQGVEYRDVSFAYNSEPVLRSVSLRASPGELIAVVGRSGAGKSTLLDLLCRYYDPQGGQILIDGLDLRRLRRESLRRHVSVVAQETFLFNTTIAGNIRYGKPEAGPEEVEAAARAAVIHEFIRTLERGYDTVVGERGAKLSGGQRQRISIARAILRDPSILILDEATSALDTEAEKQVQEALGNLIRSGARRRITFVIAHRLSTVRQADRILVLDEGRIAESGRHEELLGRDGIYAQLHRLQLEEG